MAASKVYKVDDLKQHTTDKSCWLAINGKVYDVTPFLEEHPGGYDIILTSTGKDATQDFEEIGHSNSAKQLLEKYLIGSYEGGAPPPKAARAAAAPAKPVSTVSRTINVLLPVAILAAAVAINYYLSKRQ
eukprot:CAMPEP_0202865772 /NCGR_PEP_ID=MMETSP1391-20130828/6345_1 /ASSEMBLY_ACC=CAM_ASM_000867 /TAXON_ID=1034604 /ORGANISM="Chlamydomonas leiostraca, Strain SAG 11-49" /LENGTH=129 /DNA_ID=CAMNT_0049545649 /DNA_START=13 /DNA_END=402 /DNA_ORIENTATION=+